MLTPERIKELSHPIVARVELHHDQATNVTGNLWIEGIERFAVLIEAEARAAARAEVEPLVLELLGAAQMANHGSDCATLHGGTRCDCWKHQLTKKVQAWLSPQVGDKGDGNAHT